MSSPSASSPAASASASPIPSSCFPESTHCRYWLFSSPEHLQQQRELYYNQYQQRRQEEMQQQAAASASASSPATAPAAAAAAGGKRKEKQPGPPLSLAEQSSLLLYYQLMIPSLSSLFSPPLPPSVQCTASLYLHRFYTRHSVQSYHPKQLMLACIMLACKVEEHYVSPAKIAEKVKGGGGQQEAGGSSSSSRTEEKVREMVRLEVPLLEGIGFHLRCYHPHRAARGLIKAMREADSATSSSWSRELSRDVEAAVLQLVNRSYWTEAVLLYSHSQIALAAVDMVAEEMRLDGVDKLLHLLFGADSARHSQVREKIKEIRVYLQQGRDVDIAAVQAAAKAIDKKLQRCRDLRFDPSSAEYAAVQARREEEKQRKREEKQRRRSEEEAKRMDEIMGGAAGGGAAGGGFMQSGTADDEEEFVIIKRAKLETAEDAAREAERERRRRQAEKEMTAAGARFGPFS